eukprot:UN02409
MWQFRVIIWKAENVVIKDETTNQNDLFVRCKLDMPIAIENPTKRFGIQDTDLHFPGLNLGQGSWNLAFIMGCRIIR